MTMTFRVAQAIGLILNGAADSKTLALISFAVRGANWQTIEPGGTWMTHVSNGFGAVFWLKLSVNDRLFSSPVDSGGKTLLPFSTELRYGYGHGEDESTVLGILHFENDGSWIQDPDGRYINRNVPGIEAVRRIVQRCDSPSDLPSAEELGETLRPVLERLVPINGRTSM